MGKIRRPLLLIMLIVNAVVLLGQLWPQGAPPFARVVNIVFLIATLVYFISMLFGAKKTI
jgi:hypothetical protein